MTLSDLKFTATQCLYTLELNRPSINNNSPLMEVDTKGILVLRKRNAKDLVKAAYDLAEMLIREGEMREATLIKSSKFKGNCICNTIPCICPDTKKTNAESSQT